MACCIIDAKAEHADALEALEKQCFSVPWTKEQLLSQFTDDRHEFIVAVKDDMVLGYVGMMVILDEGYISNVAFAPAFRRQGIADALICELIKRATAHALSFVTLEVRAGNKPAKALYEKHGFVPVGIRKKYYMSPVEDAILMTNFLK